MPDKKKNNEDGNDKGDEEGLGWIARFLRPKPKPTPEVPPAQPSLEIIDLIERAGSEPHYLETSGRVNFTSIDHTQEAGSPDDKVALDFARRLLAIRRVFDDFLTHSRMALDLLTFPTSCNYEPLSRLRGTLFLLSYTYRNIKLFGTFEDRASFRSFIKDELKEFKKRSLAFHKDCSRLIEQLKENSELLNSKLSILRRIEKKLNLEVLASKGGRETKLYIWPVYRSEQDPRDVTYYEAFKTNEDHDDLSANLLWTDKYLFFKLFKSKNWFNLKELMPRTQLTLLISLNEQVRLLFLSFQLKLGQVIDKFNKNCTNVLTSLDPFSTSLAQASEETVSDMIIFRIQCEVQCIETSRSRMKQMLEELEKTLKWIFDVTPDIVAMAPLDIEEGNEYLWKMQSCAQNPLYKAICCPRPLDAFFMEDHEIIRIRVCITPKLKQLLLTDSALATTVNSAVKKLLDKMEVSAKAEHKLLRNKEYDGILETRSKTMGSEITLAYFEATNRLETKEGNTFINVYTVGHSVRDK